MHKSNSSMTLASSALRWASGSSLLSSKCCYLSNSWGRGVV